MMVHPIGTRLRAGRVYIGRVIPGDIVRVTDHSPQGAHIIVDDKTGARLGDTWSLTPHFGWEVIEDEPHTEERYVALYQRRDGEIISFGGIRPRSFDDLIQLVRGRDIRRYPKVYIVPARAVALDENNNLERFN